MVNRKDLKVLVFFILGVICIIQSTRILPETELINAIRSDSAIKLANIVLQNQIRLKTQKIKGIPILLYAIENASSDEIVVTLLRHGAEANCVDREGNSILWTASSTGRIGIITALLIAKANCKFVNPQGYTSLEIACQKGHCSTAAALINFNPASVPNIVDELGPSSLHLACKHGNLNIVKLLLLHKAKTSIFDHTGLTPLHKACKKDYSEIAEELIRGGALVNLATDQHLQTPLHLACKHSSINAVKVLLSYDANPNLIDDKGFAPIHEACQHNYYSIVETLLQHSVCINSFTKSLETPLHIACTMGHVEIVALLLLKKAKIDLANRQTLTPLHKACQEKHLKIVDMLLEASDNGSRARIDSLAKIYLYRLHIASIDYTN